MIRRHSCITTCIWCSISRMVTPVAAIDSMNAIRPRVWLALMPANGSSSSSSFGRATSATAIARRFCCSCVRLRAADRRGPPRSTMPSASTSGGLRLALFARQPRAAQHRVQQPGRRALPVADQHVFERGGILEERRRLEGARQAAPRDLVRLRGRSPPGRRTRFARSVAGSARLIRLKNVVLPAPLGPMMPVIDPAATAKSTSSTARRPPNDLLTRCVSSSIIAPPSPGLGARPRQRVATRRRGRSA